MTKSDLKSMTVAELKVLAKKKKVTLASGASKADVVDALAGAFKTVKASVQKAGAVVKKAVKAKATKKKTVVAAGKRAVRKTGEKKQPLPKKATPRAGAKKKASPAAVEKAVKSTKRIVEPAGSAKPAANPKPVPGSVRQKATPVHEWKLPALDEEPLIAHERVANSKYYTGPDRNASSDAAAGELPRTYGQDRMVLMTRDPFVMYAYWETTPERLEREKAWFGWDSVLCIRVYDISGIQFDGRNALGYFDQEVGDRTGSWYFDLGRPGHSFCADIGLLSPSGRFLTLSRSNPVTMPREGVSEVIDEEWSLGDEEFWNMYGYETFRNGVTSPGMHVTLKRKRTGERAQGASSPGLFSPGWSKTKRK